MKLPDQMLGFSLVAEAPLPMKGYPVFFSKLFAVVEGRVGEIDCLLVMPREEARLTAILKVIDRLQNDFMKPCVVVSDHLSSYQVRQLTEKNYAWIVSEERFFLPFIGLVLMSAIRQRPRKGEALSPQAQRVAGHILDQSWAGKTTSEVAFAMEKSLSSVSNYFAEIAAWTPEAFVTEGRARSIASLSSAQLKEVWEKLEDVLPSPCVRKAYVKLPEESRSLEKCGFARAGMTALSSKTMLGDDPWPTYAIGDAEVLRDLEDEGAEEIEEGDGPDALVEIWAYEVESEDGVVRDVPLYLSLRGKEQEDPRLDDALEMLKERIGL